MTIDQVVEELPTLAADEPTYDQQELVQHVRFRSPMLSEFWGTDVFLKAWILLPYNFFDVVRLPAILSFK